MNKRVWLIRKIGITSLEGNATFTNLIGKKILSKFRIDVDSSKFKLLRSIYRRTGKFKSIETSYSVFGEDQVLIKYLPEIDGSYIDIGAAAPTNGSNTYLLYERGWRGITIDPIVSLIKKHKRIRPNDVQINACVSSQPEQEITFFQYIADDFSTNSVDRMSELAKMGIHPASTYSVPNILISDLGVRCDPLMPTLLNVDVEGSELDALMSINWDSYRPRVIAIEEWTSPIYVKTDVRILLENLNYNLVSRCFLTSIYVHQNYLQSLQEKDSDKFKWFNP
jgi:FkbM family methyltransferase